MSDTPSPADDAPVVEQDEVPAWRLVSTLGLGGALAGLLLVFVHQLTAPVIAEHERKVLAAAVQEVLAEPDEARPLYLVDGKLVAALPEDAEEDRFERVFAGYRDARLVGFAIPAQRPGFQDVIRLIFGYDPASRRLLGMRVLDNKETPGLGDKIEKDPAFTGQFEGRTAPLAGVKKGKAEGPGDIDMITGATISSKAVVRIVNEAVERLQPALEAYAAEVGE